MAVSQYRTRSSKDNVFTFEKFWREVRLSLAELYFYLHHNKSDVRFYQNLIHTVKASKRCCYWKTDRKKKSIWKKCKCIIVSRNYLTSSWSIILSLFCMSFFRFWFFMEMLQTQYSTRKWSTIFSFKNTYIGL